MDIFERTEKRINDIKRAFNELNGNNFKPKCHGSLKPVNGTCVGCSFSQGCLEEHENGYLKREGRFS